MLGVCSCFPSGLLLLTCHINWTLLCPFFHHQTHDDTKKKTPDWPPLWVTGSNWTLFHLLALHLFYFVSASSLLCISWLLITFSCSCNRERGSAKQLWSSCIWHWRSSSLKNVSIPSSILTSVLHYFINSALNSQVRKCLLSCTRGEKLRWHDARWNKKVQKFLVGFLLLAFRKMESHLLWIQ